MQKPTNFIGGQAVIEGVLMRNKNTIAIAVRTEKGKIILKKEILKTLAERYPIFQWPFLRGIVAFFQMLVVGIKALTYSTNVALGEEEEVLSFWEIAGILAFSLLLSIGLFVLVPYIVTSIIGFDERTAPIAFNLVDGVIKLIFFIAYVALIGMMNDIKRVFQYHGAEHKAVHCHESGLALTVKNVQKFPTVHPRCGTSFIAFVLLIGIFLLSVIAPTTIMLFPSFVFLSFFLQKGILFFLRILFLLPIASVSYEVLKLAGRYKENRALQLLNAPGLLIQKITTREPDDRMVQVAVKALKAVL